MSKVILTRYLYQISDVKNSLLFSVLEKKDINECYYWLSELYYSGYKNESWDMIMRIFYEFYALSNIKMNKYIVSQYGKWVDKNDIKYLADIIKNLFYCSSDCFIFLVNNVKVDNITSVVGNKIRRKIILNNKKKYVTSEYQDDEKFINALNKKDIKFIISFIKKSNDIDVIIKNIEIFTNKKILTNKYFKDIKTLAIVHIIQFYFAKHKLQKRKLKILKKEMKFINQTNENISPTYKTLKLKRIYKIHKYSNILKKIVLKENIKTDILWYHWEYYAYKSPIWKERFDKYKIKIDNKEKTIVFENDDDIEDFYEKYGYEPDEQSKEVQYKSINTNINYYLIDFIKNIYPENKITSNNLKLCVS